MFKNILNLSNVTLIVALSLSAIAAYYSIIGLTAIYAGAFIPIIIMGSILEIGKITTTIWLRKYWNRCGFLLKLYLVPAVIALALLTSMGIFGFLSKAHIDQGLISGDVQGKIAIYDEQIKTAKDNIDANRKALKQLDEAVDQIMGRSNDEKGAEKSVAVRRSQQKERTRLQEEIQTYQKTISRLSEERAPIAAEVRKVEAEVGPIKYIAALIYGDNPDKNLLESAVRWVSILLVLVFDPLAIALVLAANQSRDWDKEKPQYEIDDGPLTDEQIDQLKKSVEISKTPLEEVINKQEEPVPEQSVFEKYPYLAKPFVHFKNLTPLVHKPEITSVVEPVVKKESIKKKTKKVKDIKDPVVEPNKSTEIETENVTVEAKPKELPYKELDGGYVNFEGKLTSLEALKGMRPDLFLYSKNKEISSGFGSSFPKVSNKGDIFVRVDVLPNRVFKFDGSRWIEINKQSSDSYLHDTQYITYLIKEVEEGRYDPEILSDVERQRIEEHLTKPV